MRRYDYLKMHTRKIIRESSFYKTSKSYVIGNKSKDPLEINLVYSQIMRSHFIEKCDFYDPHNIVSWSLWGS